MAAAEAVKESDQNGPLHQLAKKADAEAKVAEAKAAYWAQPDATKEGAQKFSKPSGGGGMPTWGWWAIGGVGALATILLVVSVAKKR
jgi:hypothetical protein